MLKTRHPYGFCRSYPTCSEYTKQVIIKYGLIKGVFLGIIQIIKCNPFTKPNIKTI